jgi:ral guanine nucleotide dissociation stimulator-like 1
MWETQKIRVIKAGTLEKLVESLVTFKGELDSTYVNVFLATYRTFATPKQVLELLIKRCSSTTCTRCSFYPTVIQPSAGL